MKIISLAPSVTETLCAIGCTDNLAGRTSFCDRPETIKNVPVIGGFKDITVDSIIALKPDMVIGMSLHIRLFALLEKQGIRCVEIPSLPVYRASEMILLLGNAVGKQREASQCAKEVSEAIIRVQNRAYNLPHKKVLYLCDLKCPNWAGCTIATAVNSINCQSIGRQNHIKAQEILMQEIVAGKPDLILIPVEHEQEAQQILRDVPEMKNYLAERTPLIRVFSSKALGRTGAGSGKAMEMLFETVFG